MNPFIEILRNSFISLAGSIIEFLPNLIIGIVLIGLGFLVGVSFEKVISHFLRVLKVDAFLEEAGVRKFLSRGGLRLDSGLFLGGLVKWFIVIAFILAGLEAIGLTQVNAFLTTVILAYIPQVIIATLMLLCAAVGAHAVRKAVTSGTKAFGAPAAHLLGVIASSAIWIGTLIFVLSQLGIAADFMKILFIGIVAMFSLAFGLAFGLGGRDATARLLEKIEKHVSK